MTNLTFFKCSVVAVQSCSHVQLFVTPWIAACQASFSFTISGNLFKLMSIELMMPSNHLILRCPLLLLPSICPSIRAFSNESALWIRWPKYWSFGFSISPSNEYSGLISFRIDRFDHSTIAMVKFYVSALLGHGAQLSGQTPSAAAAAKSLQLCPTLCDPIDVSPPGSPVPGILQARTLEWVAISFSNA